MSLTANTASLQSILDAVNALPEAGSGGGLPDGVSALASGTFTLAEDASGISIEHGLGVTPNFAVAILGEDVSTAENVSNTMLYNIILTKAFFDSYAGQVLSGCFVYGYFDEWGLTVGSQGGIVGMVDDRWINFMAPIIKAGHTYHWICGVLDGIQ